MYLTENQIGTEIVSAVTEIHQLLGPGLLESSYEACLVRELELRNLRVRNQSPLPLIYKDVKLEHGYRIDLLVEKKVLIEIKAVDALNDVHIAQILTYLKLSGLKLGYLINFNVPLAKRGIRRFVNNL